MQVSGIGKYPFLALQRSNLQFGQVLVGEQVEQTVQLLNQGLVPADFSVKPLPASDSWTDETIKLTPSRSGPFCSLCVVHGASHGRMTACVRMRCKDTLPMVGISRPHVFFMKHS